MLTAQINEEINQLVTLRDRPQTKKEYLFAKNPSNEIQFILSGMFLFYKSFISSQDASSCTFTPSCSEYALLCIKKQGVVAGVVNFFDRLSRCNGLSPDQYTIDLNTHLLSDPPKSFYYEDL